MTDVDPGLEVRPAVSDLGDPCATDRSLTGSKAAALARASAVRLPVLPGFVITTAAGDVASADVRAAWEAVTDAGRQAVVVRSSSTAEDLEGSSMAGRYESVVDVHGWDAFLEATRAVLDSARTAAEGDDVLTGEEPIAVLVQPMLHARAGGVLFGVEPVTGRSDRLVVSASTHGADAVVSGRVDGSRYVLARDGSIVEVDPADDGATLDRRECEGLAQLAHAVADAFGGHQDVEWALREDGRLVLLQSRPVTTKVVGAPIGPVYGRGPVTETFPEPLAPLEEDLWVPPLREALREALRLSGAAREDALDLAPLVVTVRGRVAIDLEISGELRAAPSVLQRLDPRPRLRRLTSAWRIGRLRAALPGLAGDIVHRCDDDLAEVPALGTLSDRQLLAVLGRGGHALRSLHAHEVLMGQLIDPASPRLTGTSVALRVLAHARAAGTPEDEIPRRHPVVLTLTPPRVAADVDLPAGVEAPVWDGARERDPDAVLREALRLRVRWVQELTGRAAWELGERLAARGLLEATAEVRQLRMDQLQRAVLEGVRPRLDALPSDERVPVSFRCSAEGEPVAVTGSMTEDPGTGAGGGQGTGRVSHRVEDATDGAVLVVQTLDGSIASGLHRLSGIVAETGSVLAHIAILAREASVPIVVAATGATSRFPEGALVRVDGDTGDVEVVEAP